MSFEVSPPSPSPENQQAGEPLAPGAGVVAVGKVTAPPVRWTCPNGTPAVRFLLDCTSCWANRRPLPCLLDVAAYGDPAAVPRHGQLVECRGFLVTRSWCSADGERRCNLELMAQEIVVLRQPKRGEKVPKPEVRPEPDSST